MVLSGAFFDHTSLSCITHFSLSDNDAPTIVLPSGHTLLSGVPTFILLLFVVSLPLNGWRVFLFVVL